jgi:lysophospholipase L1-like esterase
LAVTVLGLGDSITCGPEEGAFGVPPRAWAQLLAEALDVPFHRLALPGAGAPEIAGRLLPRARHGYELACVHVGTNDVRSVTWHAPTFADALGRILSGLSSVRTCVATIPLDLGRPRAGAKVADLNAIVRAAAVEHGATVVGLDDLRGWRLLFPDAVHPTALGQLEIARRAASALGLDVPLPVPDSGPRADVRHLLARHAGHLYRDWSRRASEDLHRRLRSA